MKYHNIKTEYKGVKYDSRREAEYAMELDWRVKAKDIKSWKGQEKIPMIVNDKKICTYIIDFVIIHNDGSLEYVEVKGFKTAVWRLKYKLFEALYPELKKLIVT